MAWEYSDKTKSLFMDAMNGKPGTHLGEIENADAVGVDGSIVCGDALKLFFNVEKDNENPLNDKIIEIKYQTFGCTSAIASSEALCIMIEDKQYTPIEALNIKNQDIVDFLDGLPNQKIHCSVMGAQALKAAVEDWAKKRGVDIKSALKNALHEDEDDEGRIVCTCFNLTEPFLKRKIKELELKNLDDVLNATKAGGACTTCQNRPGGIKDILVEVWGDQVLEQEETNEEDSVENSLDLKDKVDQVVEEKIKPSLKLHGGDITIVEVKGIKVFCMLEGACSSCSGAKFTLKNLVEKQLKEYVHPDISVIDL
jgi:NifU-like protein